MKAQHHSLPGRALARYDLIVLDEVGTELLFQVIAERTEKATLILTTNIPFSEWTQVLPNSRLCKALHQLRGSQTKQEVPVGTVS